MKALRLQLNQRLGYNKNILKKVFSFHAATQRRNVKTYFN